MWSEVNKKREFCILGTRFFFMFLIFISVICYKIWSFAHLFVKKSYDWCVFLHFQAKKGPAWPQLSILVQTHDCFLRLLLVVDCGLAFSKILFHLGGLLSWS